MGLSEEVRASIKECALAELSTAMVQSSASKEVDGSFVHIHIANSKVQVTQSATICKDREPYVVEFLQYVCDQYPAPINGDFIIGLHDKYNANEYVNNILVFSKSGTDVKGQVLIPDLYAMADYGGKLSIQDNLPFYTKRTKALFAGVTTGADCANNTRLQLCEWAANNKDIVDAYISAIVQMEPEDVYNYYPNAKNFVKNAWVDITSQRTYKYIINVDGNTCAWDRLPWIMASQCVCLKHKSPDVNWYYRLLQDAKHFIEFRDFAEIRSIISSRSDDSCTEIIKNANEFARTYLTHEAHVLYTGHILYHWNDYVQQ